MRLALLVCLGFAVVCTSALDLSEEAVHELENGQELSQKTLTEMNKACASFRTCPACVTDLHCGWCASDGDAKCVAGTVVAPLCTQNCTEGYSYGFCPGEPCHVYKTCDKCVRDPFCVFCTGSNSCVEGNMLGPLNSEGCFSFHQGTCKSEPKLCTASDTGGNQLSGEPDVANLHKGTLVQASSTSSTQQQPAAENVKDESTVKSATQKVKELLTAELRKTRPVDAAVPPPPPAAPAAAPQQQANTGWMNSK